MPDVPEKDLCYVKLAAGKTGLVCFADYAATVNMATESATQAFKES
ncbi:MAG: hypothetical protein J1D88_07910 [Treponema sp.]|nr:hypothetical protein [Treponema sp.]